ncbi:MAG: two-component system, OmpR family, response regulator, partial [Mycobacterium sp.]|nr:two-component system, OmpR family, response regulator [Mycobacterium sp.]
NLVQVHVSGLRRKLEAHGPRILHTVRGIGYRLQSPRS